MPRLEKMFEGAFNEQVTEYASIIAKATSLPMRFGDFMLSFVHKNLPEYKDSPDIGLYMMDGDKVVNLASVVEIKPMGKLNNLAKIDDSTNEERQENLQRQYFAQQGFYQIDLRQKYGALSVYNTTVGFKVVQVETSDGSPEYLLSFGPPIAHDAESNDSSVSVREFVLGLMLLSLHDGDMPTVKLLEKISWCGLGTSSRERRKFKKYHLGSLRH